MSSQRICNCTADLIYILPCNFKYASSGKISSRKVIKFLEKLKKTNKQTNKKKKKKKNKKKKKKKKKKFRAYMDTFPIETSSVKIFIGRNFSVWNFQSMKSHVKMNSLFLKFFCYITWFDKT